MMAGVVAAAANCDTTPPTPRGLAPGAELIALRIFQYPSGWYPDTFTADVTAGLDWLYIHRDTLKTDVVNLSLNIGYPLLYAGTCDTTTSLLALASAARRLRESGVALFASTGNAGDPGQISAPACLSTVIAMGATFDAPMPGPQPPHNPFNPLGGTTWKNWDRRSSDPEDTGLSLQTACVDQGPIGTETISCFSNSSPKVQLVAPGVWTTTSVAGVYLKQDPEYETYAGTSFSSAAGSAVAALMLEANPALTPNDIEASLILTGIPARRVDTGPDQRFWRTDAASAVSDAYRSRGKQRGDANNDGVVAVSDVFFLISHLFAGGPPPATAWQGNANCNTTVAIDDIHFLISHLFAGGPVCQ